MKLSNQDLANRTHGINHSDLLQSYMLEPSSLDYKDLNSVLEKLYTSNVDEAEIYLQYSCSESWALDDGIVRDGSFNLSKGAGIRVVSRERTGFAYTDDLSNRKLNESGKIAQSILLHGGQYKEAHKQLIHQSAKPSTWPVYYSSDNPFASISDPEKVQLLQMIDEKARKKDSRVKQVNATLAATYELILVNNADQEWCIDIRPLVRCGVSVIVEQNGRRETGYSGGGGRYSYSDLVASNLTDQFIDQAVHQALINLEAVPAPAGTMTVVLGAGWPGVLLHEAVGHGLEGDFNRKGSSAYSGMIGEKVTSSLCTIVDDGTLANRRGSLSMDDEGHPTQCTTLIENGILKSYMQDRMNARLMGVKSTGNARRQSYAHLPMPRMTNTYMLAGESEPEEIIASVKDGIYAVNFGGGQVDITSGKFVFSANEAYLIENGKITAPVKGATLIGNGPDAMNKVSMVGNDLALDQGVGVCGKQGQSLPVGVGQPTLRLDGITVGGTE